MVDESNAVDRQAPVPGPADDAPVGERREPEVTPDPAPAPEPESVQENQPAPQPDAAAESQPETEAQPASDANAEASEIAAGSETVASDSAEAVSEAETSPPEPVDQAEEDGGENVQPLELIEEPEESEEDIEKAWYILKVQVNRESSICEALQRNVKREGLEKYFSDILVPTEDVREFTKSGKQRVVKRKLYPGYILVNMAINDDTWFLVRETPGIGDFTGSAGKPTPMPEHEIERILRLTRPPEDDESKEIRSVIKFKPGDRVRVKEGTFQNLEGEVDTIDETRGRVTVMLSVFGRPTPVELEHWQVEDI